MGWLKDLFREEPEIIKMHDHTELVQDAEDSEEDEND